MNLSEYSIFIKINICRVVVYRSFDQSAVCTVIRPVVASKLTVSSVLQR